MSGVGSGVVVVVVVVVVSSGAVCSAMIKLTKVQANKEPSG